MKEKNVSSKHTLLAYLERKRIKFHLMRVELKLRRKNVDSLSERLKKRRMKNLDILNEYWRKEDFPKNTDYPGKRLPHIRDNCGTLCAMAYVIEKSGSPDLVNKLAEENNLVYIEDVKNGPLPDWLSNSGLTQEEAAEIQPSYGDEGFIGTLPGASQVIPASFWAGFFLSLLVLEAINFLLMERLALIEKRKQLVAHACVVAVSLVIGIIASAISL